jgi:hypothetical protein
MSELNQTLYTVAWHLARATKAALDGDTKECHADLYTISEMIEAYRNVVGANSPKVCPYTSEGKRPDGWMTVVEYLAKYHLEDLTYMSDLAVETSGYGVKASRMAKQQGVTPALVSKPPCFADDDHFETVKAYPEYILDCIMP